ncbi:hypothetical protein ABZ604_11615 [Streptomyces sp. NPDC012473]|uniref:hypothetical protein n=1 Tax=Streptomyces sp. NPDC012473 TaxID=3156676 RepID=UPI00340E7159
MRVPWLHRGSFRPYGSRIDTALADDLVYFLKQVEAYEKKAAAARADHQVLVERMEQERTAGASRGQQWARDAGVVLDRAGAHLTRPWCPTSDIGRKVAIRPLGTGSKVSLEAATG